MGTKTSTSFVRERSGKNCRPLLRANVLCNFRLKTTSFGFLTLAFKSIFKEKNRVTSTIMLYMDDTLDEATS